MWFSLLLLESIFAAVPSWNEFRGPGGSGVAPADWSPPARPGPKNLAWRTTVPPGLSSPVIAGDRIFLTGLDGDRLVTLALDRDTGEEAWRRPAPGTADEKVHRSGSPAAPTPLAGDRRVVAYFGSFGLLCYDHDGELLWQREIPTPRSLYGMASSPIGHGDRLILVLDTDATLPGSRSSASRVICLERATGEIAWEAERPFHRSGWSTPTLWQHDAGTDLVVLGNGSAAGYDATDGQYRWHVTGFPRETIARPVVGNGHVFLSCAFGGVSEETLDPEPFWTAMLQFDANRDGKVGKGEMTEHFTLPFRPELPLGHPGFGMPLPEEPERRRRRQGELFGWVDKDRDGFWTREELSTSVRGRKGKPRLMAVRPGGEGDVTGSHVAWELTRGIPEIPTPLFHENRIYQVRNGGLLSAIDATRGEEIYRERLGASGQYRASPVLANGHLYLVSEQGVVTVVKAGDAFEKVHRFELGVLSSTTPVFDANTLYIRTAKELVAYRR